MLNHRTARGLNTVGGSFGAVLRVLTVLATFLTFIHAQATVVPLSQWSNADIGAPVVAGNGTYDAGTGSYTLKGSGADIWGTSDSFHFTYQPLSGDGVIISRVNSVANTNAWAKVGVMIRETLTPGSKYALMMTTPTSGTGLQYRNAASGSSVNVMTTGLAAPRWVKLERRGNVLTGFHSADGVTWVLSQRVVIAMSTDVYVGLAACSHSANALTTAVFSQIYLDPAPSTLPWPWTESAIGNSTDQGVALYDSSYVLSNLGADIWSPADKLKYVAQSLTGDGTLTIKVSSIASADSWTRLGLMMRESLNPDAKNVLLSLTTGNGLVFQSRQTTGGNTDFRTSSVSKTPPVWLKLTRSGDVFTASYSSDGTTWTTQGTETIVMGPTIQVGVAYANRSTTTWAFGVGEQLKLVTPLDTDGNGLPDAWEMQFFGHLGVSPAADSDGDGLTHFQEWELGSNPADGQPALTLVGGNNQVGPTGSVLPQPLVVKVADANTGAPLLGRAVTFKIVTGQGLFGANAAWHSTVTLSSDADGLVRTDYQLPITGGPITVRASVGDQVAGVVTFTLKSLLGAPDSALLLDTTEIGALALPSIAQYQNGSTTLTTAGGDIWNSADSFRFAWSSLSGDGIFVARLASMDATDPWAMAGVMVRETLDANSRHASLLLTPGNGVVFRWRESVGATTTQVTKSGVAAPGWLALRRAGSVITGYHSTDGVNWTQIGWRNIAMGQTVYVGFAYASLNPAVGHAVFDSVKKDTLAPAPWQVADIGALNAGNIDVFTADTMRIRAGGNDVWDRTDNFRYVYQSLPSDGRLIVRVASQASSDVWAKSGVMIRSSLDSNSRNLLLAVTPGNGLTLQWRSQPGSTSAILSQTTGTAAPVWLKLERFGSDATAYYSADGSTWTKSGSLSGMTGEMLLGLAASSHNSTLFNETLFDHVQAEFFSDSRGWSAEYFSTADLSGQPVNRRRDPALDFTWAAGQAPASGVAATNYSARWQSDLQPATSDIYTFTALATGGVRLWVDGQLVIDRWALQASATEVSGQVVLQAGTQPKVIVEYFNGADAGRIQLRWSNSTMSDALVPTGAVRPSDSDSDGIPDSWETAHGLNPLDSADAVLDPDQDGLFSLFEYQSGLNPTQKNDRIPAQLVVEEWQNISGNGLNSLTDNSRFPRQPSVQSLLNAGLNISQSAVDNYGRRIRGYLVPPVDGDYQFWVSGDDQTAFWLSPTDSPFERTKIARVDSYTNYQAFDRYSEQASKLVKLQAGHAYYFEVLQKEGVGGDHVSVAWRIPGGQRQLIGANYVTSFTPRADDLDGDGLPDAWKLAHGLDPAKSYGLNGAYGDLDGDGLINLEECQLGTDPTMADTDEDGMPDMAELELGTNPLDSASFPPGAPAPWQLGAIGSEPFQWVAQADGQVIVRTDSTPFSSQSDTGGILYQTITGDFTCDGSIHFPDAARSDLEGGIMVRDSLETDAAYVSITRSLNSGWLVRHRPHKGSQILTSDLSSALSQSYNQIAVRRVGSMVSLYGQTMSGVPRKLADYPLRFTGESAIVGYVAWSISASSPGSIAFSVGSIIQSQGDQGMPNDTGLTTFDSVRWMGEWDGIVSPSLDQGILHIPSKNELLNGGAVLAAAAIKTGSSVDSSVGPWAIQGSSIDAQDRRGELTWKVQISEAALHLVEFVVREARASKTAPSNFPLKLFVDGHYVGTRTVTATPTQSAAAFWFSPWLGVGEHTIRLIWDGSADYTFLRVDTLSLDRVGGLDADGNGQPDWADRRVHLFNGIDASGDVVNSAVSPLPIEGRARWSQLTSLSVSGSPVQVHAGAGYRWYAEVPLVEDTPLPLVYSGEAGAVQRTLSVNWTSHDALTGGSFNFRVGSSLRIAVAASVNETATLTRNGVGVPLSSGVAQLVFPAAGTYRLIGRVVGTEGIREAETVVNVFDTPTLPELFPGMLLRERIISRPSMPSGIELQADPRLELTTVPTNTTQISWLADDNVDRRVVARIGTDGPVLAGADAPGTALYATLDTYTRIIETLPDGTQDTETLVILSPVRPGHAIKLEIFVAGVVFADGTRTKVLSPSDLDALGQARVRLLRPPGTTTSVCHRTMLLHNETVIGTK